MRLASLPTRLLLLGSLLFLLLPAYAADANGADAIPARAVLEHAVLRELSAGRDAGAALARLKAMPKAARAGGAAAPGPGFTIALDALAAALAQPLDRDDWRGATERVEAEILLVEARFDDDRERLAELGLSASLLTRIEAGERKFDTAIAPLRDALAELRQSQAAPPAREHARSAITAALHQAPVRILGVRELPNRRTLFAPRDLPALATGAPSFADVAAADASSDDRAQAAGAADPTVLALARTLNYEYTAIHDFVRSQVRTDWYVGVRRSPAQTLAARAGNDAEQAALLIALLRASGAAARFVHGVIELPLDRLASMTGFIEASDIGRLLTGAGIAHEPIMENGSVRAFRIEHVFVSAFVPYGNYRGSTQDRSAAVWIPLAPALKPHRLSGGNDLVAAAAIDTDAFVADSIAAADAELPLERLRAHLDAALAGQGGLEAVARSRNVAAQSLGLLPGSLPGRWIGLISEQAQLQAAQMQQLTVRLYRDADATDTDGEVRLFLSDLAERRLTLSFQPATSVDQDLMNGYGGLSLTPAYLVRLRARLMVDGEPVLVSGREVTAGDAMRVELEVSSPAGALRTGQTIVAGTYVAIDADARVLPPPAASDAGTAPPDGEFGAADLLANLARRYRQQWREDEEHLAAWTGVEAIAALPSITLATTEFVVERQLDLPYRMRLRGVSLDAALHPMDAIAPVARSDSEARFLRLSALHGSALEHRVFEQHWSVPAISTVRGLKRAADDGIPVLNVHGGVLPPEVDLPATIEMELSEQLARGLRLQVAVRELSEDTWHGAVWRSEDPATGESGWFIAGGYAGGATVQAPEAWLLAFLNEVLGSPYSPAPNPDPASAFYVDIIGQTDDQVSVVGEPLELPLAVRVTDRDFRPVQGARVRFSVVDSEATIGPAGGAPNQASVFVESDSFGVARVSARPAERIGWAPQNFYLNADDPYPTAVSMNLVTAQVVMLDGVDGPMGRALRFFGRPGTVSEIKTVAPLDVSPHVHAGAYSSPWTLSVKDAYGNDVSNARSTTTRCWCPDL